MARRISELRTANKAGNTSREFVLLSNIDSNSSTKLALNDIFPTLQSGKISSGAVTGTLGNTVQDLFVGGGAGSSVANTDKSVLIFKGINATDTNGALKIKTDTSNADSNKKNIVIDLDQTAIKLNVATNTTSKFLSEATGTNPLDLQDTSHYMANRYLPVGAGGTGASTFTANGLLYGAGTSAVNSLGALAAGALVIGTGSAPVAFPIGAQNDMVLTVDSGQSNNLIWKKPVVSTFTATTDIDFAGNDIDMGGGWITGSGTTGQGIYVNNTNDHVYFGDGTTYATSVVNIDSTISLGTSTGSTTTSITAKPSTSGASSKLSIIGSHNSNNNNGGAVDVVGGDGQDNGNGGDVTIAGGIKAGSGTQGSVKLQSGGLTGLTVDGNYDVTVGRGSLVISSATEGIVHTGSGTVTQATDHSTGVTINATSGIITLAGVALVAATEADFAVTNSTVQSDSIILLTVQSPAAASANNSATLVAQLDEVNNGSFNIRLSNPGAGNTSTSAHKIHFLVINNSV
jgi:hypothetical protein